MKDISIQSILVIAQKAGEKIMEIYKQDFSQTIEIKGDDSPLTIADKAANEIIEEGLNCLAIQYPVLSEEGRAIDYTERKEWSTFWCVDPLDGTKEFIKKNGMFTVNIALIENGFPIMGVVYAPALDIMYYSDGKESFKIEKGIKETIQVNRKIEKRVAVQSASHASDLETEFLSKYDVIDTISVGSSLKFCQVAEGKADIYFRSGPTMEWDTAAGQAVAEGAGARVEGLNQRRFSYNKENLLNDSFVVFGF